MKQSYRNKIAIIENEVEKTFDPLKDNGGDGVKMRQGTGVSCVDAHSWYRIDYAYGISIYGNYGDGLSYPDGIGCSSSELNE